MAHHGPSGFVPALAALIGNIIVALLKWAGFFLTGSSALFSEAVHSVADIANQAFLIVGVVRTKKRPDRDFVYGYGRERFFWALISACGIFFAGAGVTIVHGIQAWSDPAVHGGSSFNESILLIAFIVESFTFFLAYRSLAARFKGKRLRVMLEDGDPVTVAVLYEDGIAVIGVAIAFLSIELTRITGSGFWDPAGSILIGALLAVMAIVLIRKNHDYLLGRAMPEQLQKKIIKMLEADPVIEKVIDFKSTTLGLDEHRIKCEIEVNGSALFSEIREREFIAGWYEDVVASEEDYIRFCVDYADRIPRVIGEHINKVEARVQKAFPTITHIDIELN